MPVALHLGRALYGSLVVAAPVTLELAQRPQQRQWRNQQQCGDLPFTGAQPGLRTMADVPMVTCKA